MDHLIKLHEATSDRITLPEGKGDKYAIRIISPGEGSSGIYPADMLERDVPAAFPKGTRMRANHDGLCEDGGDIRRVIAKTISAPYAESDGSMWTQIQVSEQWNGYFKEFADVIGVSISAAGEYRTLTDENGDETVITDEDTGKPIIGKLYSQEESPYNSIDFVEAPGANGRIMLALEGAQKHIKELNVREQASFASPRLDEKNSEAVPPRSNQKENRMDEEERNALAAEITEKVTSAVIAAVKPREAAPEETKFENVAEAAFKAGLSEGSREAVYESVRAGASVEDAIAKETKREEQITAAITERLDRESTLYAGGAGVVMGEGAGSSKEFDELVEQFVGGEK